MLRLPHWCITDMHPAFYDTESKTTIEMVGRVYGKMNELVDSYNTWVDKINEDIEAFENSTDKNAELFATCLRQEFQDFIDTVELNLMSKDKEIKDAVTFMTTNLNNSVTTLLKEIRENGELSNDVLIAFKDIVNDLNNEITNRQQSVSTLQTNINNERNERLANEKVLNERMNTFSALEEGSTTGDAELMDARTDFNGVTHENVGEHIRSVTGQLYEEIGDVKSDLINRAVSVISFGAVPDGKTDCAEAFRKAFEFSSCVFVPEGNYYISGDITLPDNAHFYGINPLKSHIFLNSVGGAFKFNGSSVLNGGTHKSFLNIHDLTIERKNSDDITTEPSLDISYSGFVSLRNVHFIKGKQQVSGWEVFDSVFTECKFMNSDYTSDLAAVRLSSGGGYAERTNNITFNNCIWESFCGKAIYINSVANDDNIRANKLYFNNCKFESKFIETGVIPIFIIGLDCLFMKNIFCCVNKGNAYNGIIYINGDINEAIFSNIQFDYEWTSKAEQEYMNPIRFVYGLARYVNIDMFFYNANDIYNPTDDNLYVEGNIVNKRVIANGYSNY